MRFKPDFSIDIHWLHRVSHKLDLFRRASPSTHVYECRCPVCGDSKKNSRKARCHFYEKQRSLNVHCKNCGYSHSFYTFMKDVFRNEFDEYKKDQLRQSIESLKPSSGELKSKTVDQFKNDIKTSRKTNITILDDCICVYDLDNDHEAKRYLKSRSLTDDMLKRLYFTNSFKTIASKLSYQELNEDFPDDARIVIPFFSEDGERIEMMQGRSLNPKSKMRYISIKSDPNVDKIFGKNEIDPTETVYCVEGPFDSLFIDNCLATCDSNLTRAEADVYIYDNEPRNPQIVKLIEKTIEMGKFVVIWPVSPMKKLDINDMIVGGIAQKEIMQLIKENTFSGAKAKLKLLTWRKV